MPFVDDDLPPLDPRIARSLRRITSLVHGYGAAIHAILGVLNRLPEVDGVSPAAEIRAALEEVQRLLPTLPPRITDEDALLHLQVMINQLDNDRPEPPPGPLN